MSIARHMAQQYNLSPTTNRKIGKTGSIKPTQKQVGLKQCENLGESSQSRRKLGQYSGSTSRPAMVRVPKYTPRPDALRKACVRETDIDMPTPSQSQQQMTLNSSNRARSQEGVETVWEVPKAVLARGKKVATPRSYGKDTVQTTNSDDRPTS